jgi:hypothetical protein
MEPSIELDNVHSDGYYACFDEGGQVEKKQEARAFGIMDLARLVGIQPALLNKFIQRGKYGIAASVQPGKGQGRERRFGEKDVYGIALVYWLFESGLRSESIQYVLNQICDGKLRSGANDAASNVLRRTNNMLAISREPRRGYEKHPAQKTRLVDTTEASRLVRENSTASVLIIPVGSLFASLREMMEVE